MTPCIYCSRQGWPTLDGLCERHYRDLVVYSLHHAVFRANQEHMDALEKVYKVECALGLRPYPYTDPIHTAEDRRLTSEVVERRSAPGPRRGAMKRATTSDDEKVVL